MPKKKSIFSLIRTYKRASITLIVIGVFSNALALVIPTIISRSIDAYSASTISVTPFIVQFSLIAIAVCFFALIQGILQAKISEKVARDLRSALVQTISKQSFSTIESITPQKLLTNITSDSDGVKTFISQALPSLVSSIILIFGSAILLLSINWKLGLVVLAIIPLIGIAFSFVFKHLGPLFMKSQQIIDGLNRVISETIIGASLIRILNTGNRESDKFSTINTEARDLGLKILSYFVILIPAITFTGSLATLAVVLLGGHYTIIGSMTIGEFAAFNTYIGMLIFPIIIIGFISNIIAQASASFTRITDVLDAPEMPPLGTRSETISGLIEIQDVTVQYEDKKVLDHLTLTIQKGTRVAITGPTAAGKTQLLYALIGLITPTSGQIRYDNILLETLDPESLHNQIGLVFQDSALFNTTLRENIAFNSAVDEATLAKAIQTAELTGLIASLPDGLDTIVSERGTSLSGGQKQRIMLARALALNPTILLLDDFTARVDIATEKRILENIAVNYPDITLLSVTQKINSTENYDTIVLLIEGEIVAQGTHTALLEQSPEYAQLYYGGQSTNQYE